LWKFKNFDSVTGNEKIRKIAVRRSVDSKALKLNSMRLLGSVRHIYKKIPLFYFKNIQLWMMNVIEL